MKHINARPAAPETADDMYVSAAKIYPREVTGRYQKLRTLAAFWLLGMYYLFPWLKWDGRQAVLFDLPARKFYVFGLSFWPQDFFYLSMLLMMAAFSLFFFTALAGRLWCGYACPQTVWTEVFLWLERLTEGGRAQRMKLDARPLDKEKLLRKSAKQFLWISFALWTGFTFVGFFTPIRDLAARLLDFQLGGWETFWLIFYSFATYGNAGFLREQVCKYMCPYARFQGAMFDPNTLIISYDTNRGDPRGSRKKTDDPRTIGLGDCIDCTICVQVCPVGIDIRNGLQYECIACGACIDACDQVMDKMNYPRGLVRYTTEQAMAGKRSRILRPRILIYSSLLLILVSALTWSVSTRLPLSFDVLRDRNALYRIAADGAIENAYTLKILNKDQTAHRYIITASGVPGLEFRSTVEAGPEEVVVFPATLRAPQQQTVGRSDITFTVVDEQTPDITRTERSSFFAPSAPHP